MIAGGDPPGYGCWEVTATYRGHELSYVYWRPANLIVASTASGLTADDEVEGILDFDPVVNCYLIHGSDGVTHPVVWPSGTTASTDGLTVNLPGQEPIDVATGVAVQAIGDLVSIGSEDLPLPPYGWCGDQDGEVWVISELR